MKYTLEQATQKAVLRNRPVKLTIKKIMEWETTMTAMELCKMFKLSRVAIYKFANAYNLEYARYGKRQKTNVTRVRQRFIEQMVKDGLPIRDMALVLGVKHQYITQIRTA